MKRIILAAALCGSLAACTPAQIGQVQSYHEKIAAACRVAMMVGAFTPVGPWIIGGCASEAAIAKLALDGNSLNWLNDLINKAKGLSI